MAGAVERSCNVAPDEDGADNRQNHILKYMQDFNFELKTNIDLYGGSQGRPPLYLREDSMGPMELATASFGLGL